MSPKGYGGGHGASGMPGGKAGLDGVDGYAVIYVNGVRTPYTAGEHTISL